MKLPQSTFFFFMMMWFVASLLMSCSHKDIDCPAPEAQIEVVFEWDKAHNAAVDGMTLFFYPLDNHSLAWRFDIAGCHGGRMELPPGTYRLITCNNDLPGIRLDDTGSYSTIRAVAARRVEKNVYETTGMLYGAVIEQVQVTPCIVSYSTPQGTIKECRKGLIRCQPDSLSTLFTVIINHVKGIERIRAAKMKLTPVSAAMLLDNNQAVGDYSGLYAPMTTNRGEEKLSGIGCAFGLAASADESYTLTVNIDTTDGKKITKSIDIKRENVNSLSSHNVLISVDRFDVTGGSDTPSGDVGGIKTDVEGWETVDIELTPLL